MRIDPIPPKVGTKIKNREPARCAVAKRQKGKHNGVVGRKREKAGTRKGRVAAHATVKGVLASKPAAIAEDPGKAVQVWVGFPSKTARLAQSGVVVVGRTIWTERSGKAVVKSWDCKKGEEE